MEVHMVNYEGFLNKEKSTNFVYPTRIDESAI